MLTKLDKSQSKQSKKQENITQSEYRWTANTNLAPTGQKHTDPVWTRNVAYEDGEWWWKSPSTGTRARITKLNAKNARRMYVGGVYIPQTHPLWKAGRYASWEQPHSHIQLNAIKEGYVYLITNPAWDGWVKCGRAVDAVDRCRSYNTSSPYRDYKLTFKVYTNDHHVAEAKAHIELKKAANETRGEWFKVGVTQAKRILKSILKGN